MNPRELKSLSGSQVRTLAYMLGHPRGLKQKSTAIQWVLDYASASPDNAVKVGRAFEVVAYGKLDTLGSEQTQGVDMAALERRAMEHGILGAKSVLEKAEEEVSAIAKRVLAEAAADYRPIAVVMPDGKKKPVKGKAPKVFERLVQLASARRNILMVGPAGCGKTHVARMVAEALGLAFAAQSCTEGMSESYLTGWMLPIGKGGQFSYVPAQFVELYEKGGLFLLDEVDALDPNVLLVINQALANNELFIPQRHEKPRIQRHKDFVCMAAANTFGNGGDSMYVGRNQLDAASLDRFRAGIVMLDYDEDVERSLIQKDVLTWGWRIRAAIRQHRMRRIMSTRVMIDMAAMVAAYKWTQKEWEEAYFADWSVDERRRAQGGV